MGCKYGRPSEGKASEGKEVIMYIYYKGVQYDVADLLSRNACEIHLEWNGANGLWTAKVDWHWNVMAVGDYDGDSIEDVMSKAARDRIEEGDKES